MNRMRFPALCVVLTGLLLFALTALAVSNYQHTLTADSPTASIKAPPEGEAPPPSQATTKQGGDTVADAVVIPSVPYSNTGTTVGYTNDYDEVCTFTGSTAPDVVYSYTPATTEWVDMEICQSDYDTKMYIYENTVTPGSPFACNDDACGSDGYKSELPGLQLVGGNTYYIVIDGYGSSSGTYFLNITEGDPPPDCPVDTTMFGQPTHTPSFGGWSAGVSDVGFIDGPLLRYEYFTGLSDDIVGLHFWAISAYNDGSSWFECDETPRDLQVIFYPDVAGQPGTAAATFDVTVSGTPTGMLFSGFELDEYRVDLTGSVSLSDGWVSIQGTDASTCWFLWMSGYGLDSAHMMLDTASILTNEDSDMSLCILGPVGDPVGACCNAAGGCEVLTEAECAAAGGTYQGDGTNCTPNPCPQPCCVGTTGNVDDDAGGNVDLQDVIYLVNTLFLGGDPVPCPAAANIDGDAACNVDLPDVIALVNALFLGGAPPAPCDPACE
ncbi:hypothetical protein GF420_06920 [candidate division GN15 bacterium]|nr:hypothetical protein [candidate division GN15 bacterium]